MGGEAGSSIGLLEPVVCKENHPRLTTKAEAENASAAESFFIEKCRGK